MTAPGKLDGVALVTGGTGGLGRAVVSELLDAGATVVTTWLVERERESIEQELGSRDGLHLVEANLLEDGGPQQVARAATDWCAQRGDCLYVGSAPDREHDTSKPRPRTAHGYTDTVSAYVRTIVEYAAPLQAAKVYGALYAPWVMVPDPGGPGPAATRVVPADGHVLGVYARTELERGIAKAPAGDAAVLRGVLGTVADLTQEQHTDLVRTGLTNGLLTARGRGTTVAASRTLSSDTRWSFVNVRLLFNFVKATLRDGLRYVRQEPHTGELRRSLVTNVVTPFLLGLWRQGAFGSDPPEDVFTVKCDAENNPPAQVDQGLLQLEVYFYAARPAETIRILVGQRSSGAGSATES